MKQDFHFYCIGVLANAAGFSKEEALTIAYSSQYVTILGWILSPAFIQRGGIYD